MLDTLKNFFAGLNEADHVVENRLPLDKKLSAAALMVHVIVADGKITEDEEKRLNEVLSEHYAVNDGEARELAEAARDAQSEAVDLYGFTSILKAQMSEEERLALIEDLWEMVYADGTVHEFEDNVVWRAAELLGIQSR
ncbi:MAG: TerB family tellurite resistance protein, partial [Pseudomonadota bacterium]